MPNPDNILVIRLSSLGDVLMSIPAVVAVRKKYRDARIVWLVEGSVSRFLSCQNFIDEVIEFPRSSIVKDFIKGNFISAGKKINNFLKELRKTEYDIVVDLHGIIKSAIFSVITRTSRRVGYGKMYAKEKSHLFYNETVKGSDRRIHKVERNMLIAGYLGAGREVPDVELVVPDEANRYIDDFLSQSDVSGPIFAVNPFFSSGSEYKRWSIDNYGSLIRKIKDETCGDVLILWGPGEKEEAEKLRQISGNNALLSCPTDVPQLFALLKKVDMYIGGDTGVMHLAALGGRPVVAIFGPTDVEINAPYGCNNMVVRKDLPCSPCKNKNCENRKCIENITVKDVFEAVMKMHGSIN